MDKNNNVKEERIQQISCFLEQKKDLNLKEFLNSLKPEDIAEILREFSVEDKISVFKLLNNKSAAVVLDDTDSQTRLQLLQKIDSNMLAHVLDHMPVDEAADIVEEIPEKDRNSILGLLEKKEAKEVKEILAYPEDSAGRVMNPKSIYVFENNDVEDAINCIRNLKVVKDFFYVYVVDNSMHLQGVVSMRKLLTVPKGTLIKDIMNIEIHSVFVNEDQEKVAMIMKKYDLFSLPVVDNDDCLVGRITFDDIIDVMDEERGEDISRMTGTIEEEQGTETVFEAAKNRLPWLVICMIGSIFTGIVIQLYELTLTEIIALVSFIPVITATGGNSGVQASTVVVREIALGHMNYTRVLQEVWRQIKVALGLGLVCGTILSVLANIWKKNTLIGLVVGVAIFLVVVWSNFVGVITPILFKKIKVDPAIASGPLITTLNDIIGVFIYLSIATLILL